jgi:hypothetical protein
LTIEETFEFETLDSLPALDESGNHVAWDEYGVSATTLDKAWIEWMVETYADRSEGLAFIN